MHMFESKKVRVSDLVVSPHRRHLLLHSPLPLETFPSRLNPRRLLLTEPCDCGYDTAEIIAQNISRKIRNRTSSLTACSVGPVLEGQGRLWVHGWAGTRHNIDGIIGNRTGNLLNVGVDKAN